MPRRPSAADTPILPNQDVAPPLPKNEDDDDDDDGFNGDDDDDDEEAADADAAALVAIDVMFSPKQNSSLIFVAGVQLQFRNDDDDDDDKEDLLALSISCRF